MERWACSSHHSWLCRWGELSLETCSVTGSVRGSSLSLSCHTESRFGLSEQRSTSNTWSKCLLPATWKKKKRSLFVLPYPPDLLLSVLVCIQSNNWWILAVTVCCSYIRERSFSESDSKSQDLSLGFGWSLTVDTSSSVGGHFRSSSSTVKAPTPPTETSTPHKSNQIFARCFGDVLWCHSVGFFCHTVCFRDGWETCF